MLRSTVSKSSDSEVDLLDDRDFVQLIDADGIRHPSPTIDQWVADVSDAQLADLYEDMVVVRRIDVEATALQRQGELGLWPPLLGQEASQIGSARALRDDDFIMPSYRENGVAYCRGVALDDLVRVWRGHAHGSWDPSEFRMAIPAVIIGAQTLHAVGYGVGILRDGADSAVITYFGDGATSQGDTNEAMIFAATYQAPVVFFCQNNHWAISEPVGLQATRHISERAPGFGIPSMRVDGNDVLAVMAATRIALDRAHNGGGPTYIEAVTYRMGPHTTSDDPTRYRDADELAEWKAKDPISRLEKYFESKDLLTDELKARVKAKADSVAAEFRAGCIGMEEPTIMSVFDHVTIEIDPVLERQRSQYAAYLANFEGGE
ncbi:pyruvate dehydrogenase E1 component alpha subunit [Cryobacterium mesophilum]|uniref:Pyruvate dehydrogenase (Acetyl-transferring) E1 component subunit alpha n=1 Tax=Terrimesophilobacter mesophilus TaxID=433647 RepID=A0A4R8V7E9_9MICO|nr:pyruvate dehydrogenase E1 component alpha subunit [Terrimesophilobacter mesophilus]TFB79044.1 pyruvate dehydrogenase (acetyl-transferring) E1 component subunit alpha [Terrimesophilobacter mesophilus]